MGNVLRDNKTILNKTANIFSNAMEHRMSCIEVSFNGTITFIYKQFNFKDDLVTSPLYSKISMSDLQVFTTSVNQLSIRLLNISSILSNKNKIDCEFLKLNLRISNNSQFMSDDGMIKLGVD